MRSIQLDGAEDENDWSLEDSCYAPYEVYQYVDSAPVGNPDLQTDAEMWGWKLVEDE
jgi:hypothetical protein